MLSLQRHVRRLFVHVQNNIERAFFVHAAQGVMGTDGVVVVVCVLGGVGKGRVLRGQRDGRRDLFLFSHIA